MLSSVSLRRYALLFWTPLILYHILGAASRKKYVAEAGETMTEEQIEVGRDSVSEVRVLLRRWYGMLSASRASQAELSSRGCADTLPLAVMIDSHVSRLWQLDVRATAVSLADTHAATECRVAIWHTFRLHSSSYASVAGGTFGSCG